jgi:Rv2258c-like winged HTH domain
MLALMITIGHRSGLFDAMAALPPASSERIAQVKRHGICWQTA